MANECSQVYAVNIPNWSLFFVSYTYPQYCSAKQYLQSSTVSVYFKSKQILPFGFVCVKWANF